MNGPPSPAINFLLKQVLHDRVLITDGIPYLDVQYSSPRLKPSNSPPDATFFCSSQHPRVLKGFPRKGLWNRGSLLSRLSTNHAAAPASIESSEPNKTSNSSLVICRGGRTQDFERGTKVCVHCQIDVCESVHITKSVYLHKSV